LFRYVLEEGKDGSRLLGKGLECTAVSAFNVKGYSIIIQHHRIVDKKDLRKVPHRDLGVEMRYGTFPVCSGNPFLPEGPPRIGP
jgi:hypothetical protein